MKKNIKALVAMLLAVVTISGITIGSIGNTTPSDAPVTVIDPETGTVIEIPSPDYGYDWKTRFGIGGDSDSDDDDDNTSTAKTDDGHVPGTPRECKPNLPYLFGPNKSYGETSTVIKSVANPTKPDTKNTSNDTTYGKVDWSTAAQGYVSFTAKGQERTFVLQGPNGKQALFAVQKGETIKASLNDGAGKYQYAIANNTSDGKSFVIQYKNSFNVSKIDSELDCYLVSNPWGDYENAPVAVAKADELWDTGKTQLENIKAIAKWVYSNLKYDKSLKVGPINMYVNPDKVIENGGGVCNEMAKTTVAMLRSQGIPAYYQSGKNRNGNNHGWVMAWVEVSSEVKNGITYSTGTWVLIEATGAGVRPQSDAEKNYTPNNYSN